MPNRPPNLFGPTGKREKQHILSEVLDLWVLKWDVNEEILDCRSMPHMVVSCPSTDNEEICQN
jgi:hypothetical protein